MTATVTRHRLVVTVPDRGWLSLWWPAPGSDYRLLAGEWRRVAESCLIAAALPRLGEVTARVECRPRHIARKGETGIHVAEDLRPSWTVVRDVLAAHGIRAARDTMALGVPTGQLSPLMVVTLLAVPDVR